MAEIAIIDGDLLGRGNHRFPNLSCMKLSSYHKQKGDSVRLIMSYDEIVGGLFSSDFNQIYLSKAFTDSKTPKNIMDLHNLTYGGTGFYFDNYLKNPLPNDVEHCKPDYSLYDEFVRARKFSGAGSKSLKHYTDYSIGFTTRGCFRGCKFCVLQNETKVNIHSPVSEFMDVTRPKLCMLDDNILGCPNYPKIFEQIKETGKKFKYVQAMDIRLMTQKKAEMMLPLRYDDDYYFAFDRWEHREKVERGLKLWHDNYYEIKQSKSMWISTKLFTICAFDVSGNYDMQFWVTDIVILFKRIEIIFRWKAMPFVMRYEKYRESPFYSLYVNICQWANQPRNCGKYSFNEYLELHDGNKMAKSKKIRDDYPEFRRLFDFKLNSIGKN